jgi:hypothetical protein
MNNCEICGEPMPAGEDMFKSHGYSGPCPKPPINPKTEVVAEYVFRDMTNGEFWIDVRVNRQPYMQIGPFDTEAERQRAHDDLLNMTRSLGAKDLPPREQ